MDLLYWFSLPFVNAFNFSETIIIPMLVSLVGVGLYATMNRLQSLKPSMLDGLIVAFLGSAIMSTLFNVNSLGAKGINHLAALFASYGVLYYMPVTLSRRLSVERILAVLWIGYVLCVLFGIIEFVLVNFTNVDLDAIVHRPSALDYKPAFLDILLIRSRSLFEESGYFANYLAVLSPLMVYYLWHVKQSTSARITFIVLTMTASFVAFSVSMFIFLPTALIIASILRIMDKRRISKTMALLFVVLIVITLVVVLSDDLMNILFFRKFEGDSFQDRSEKLEVTLSAMSNASWLQILFGFGPGSYFNLGVLPSTSVYLNFWRDYGILGISAYLLSVLYLLLLVFTDKSALGQAIFLSSLIIQLFFIAIPTYYAPVSYLPMILYELRRRRSSIGKARVIPVSLAAKETEAKP